MIWYLQPDNTPNVRRENSTNCHCGHNNLSSLYGSISSRSTPRILELCGKITRENPESDKVGACKMCAMFKECAKKKTKYSMNGHTQQSPDTRPKKGVHRTLAWVSVVAGGLSDTVASHEWTRYYTFWRRKLRTVINEASTQWLKTNLKARDMQNGHIVWRGARWGNVTNRAGTHWQWIGRKATKLEHAKRVRCSRSGQKRKRKFPSLNSHPTRDPRKVFLALLR